MAKTEKSTITVCKTGSWGHMLAMCYRKKASVAEAEGVQGQSRTGGQGASEELSGGCIRFKWKGHVIKSCFKRVLLVAWVVVEVPVQGHSLCVPAALPGTLPGLDWWSIRCSLGE